MADPKIRYDVEAQVTGTDDVRRLAQGLETLDDSISPVLAQRARELQEELQRLGQQQGLIDRFREQRAAVEQAERAMQAARDEATRLGREIAQTEEPTKRQVAAFNAARTAAKAAAEDYQQSRLTLQQLRGTLGEAGLSTDELAASQVRLRQQQASVQQQLRGVAEQASALAAEQGRAGIGARELGQSAQASAAGLRTQSTAAQQASDSIGQIRQQIATVVTAAQALVGGQLLGGLVGDALRTADAYANLAAKVRLAAGEGAGFDQAFQGVFDVATRTNSSLQETGQLFTKLVEAGRALNLTQQDALSLTETVNQAVQLSGASADSSAAAVQQLVQGLQSGVLRGDEFNSVMEQAPRLAKALADGLGVTTGELRKLAEAGQLSAETVIASLRGQASAIESEYGKLPATVGRALTNLETQWTRYIGEVDKAAGFSATAAEAIGLLARNLDVVGAALTEAGKAGAALIALRLADWFTSKAAAITLAAQAADAETAAIRRQTIVAAELAMVQRGNAAAWGEVAAGLQRGTTAMQATTAAATANAAATTAAGAAATRAAAGVTGLAAASTASAGSFAGAASGALGLLSVLSRLAAGLAVVSIGWDAIRAVGTWIGESAAKLAGYRDRTKELADATEADAKAARANAQAREAAAQAAERNREAALGLSDASRKLVADFDTMRQKGDGAAEAIGKLANNLDLTSGEGIRDAITALDVLQTKGKAAASQVRDALSGALGKVDLLAFETQARAAFDAGEQGARRLRLVLDAIAEQSLARVGTSVGELRTGFSAAMTSAINNTDTLRKTLQDLGVTGDEAGTLLAKSLNKEVEAANTARALESVRTRFQEAGKQGQISGQDMADGLQKVQTKADQLKTGINSVAEAAKLLGISTQDDLNRTAATMQTAWERVRDSTNVALADKVKAFDRYREAAIAANGGVESSQIKLERQILETKTKTAGLGDQFVSSMGRADAATDKTRGKVQQLGAQVGTVYDRMLQTQIEIDRLTGLGGGYIAGIGSQAAVDARNAKITGQIEGNWTRDAKGQLQSKSTPISTGQLTPPTSDGMWEISTTATNRVTGESNVSANFGGYYWTRTPAGVAKDKADFNAKQIASKEAADKKAREDAAASNAAYEAAVANSRAAIAAQAAARNPAFAPTQTTRYEVKLSFGGMAQTIGVGSAADAEALRSFFAQLEAAMRRAGGGGP